MDEDGRFDEEEDLRDPVKQMRFYTRVYIVEEV